MRASRYVVEVSLINKKKKRTKEKLGKMVKNEVTLLIFLRHYVVQL